MYKISLYQKNMVGSNFDAYYLTSKLWFENAQNNQEYGAVFIGGRLDGINGIAPQSGMNTYGLTYTRQATYAPDKLRDLSNKKTINNPTFYLKDIIHKCKNVEDVQNYIHHFNHTLFINDVFIYVDSSGKYLIVEPDTMYIQNQPTYVIANFCPSQISNYNDIKQERYQNGMYFLHNKIDTSISFCTSLSDTMHVCREKMGDGTLVTFIRDLNNLSFHLYFYHDYTHKLSYDLVKELYKGNAEYDIPKIFPINHEYVKLTKYIIPQQNKYILYLMIIMSICLFISSGYFIINFLLNRKNNTFILLKCVLILLNILLVIYQLILIRTEYIFFFPAPYKDATFKFISLSSYIPFLVGILMLPIIYFYYQFIKTKNNHLFTKILMSICLCICFILTCFFYYWGLYQVFTK